MHIRQWTHPSAETKSLKAAHTLSGRDISYRWHHHQQLDRMKAEFADKPKRGEGRVIVKWTGRKSYYEVEQQVQAAASKSRLQQWVQLFFLTSNKLLITLTKCSKNLSGECKRLLPPAWRWLQPVRGRDSDAGQEHPAEIAGSCSNYSEQCHLPEPAAEGRILVFLGFCSCF